MRVGAKDFSPLRGSGMPHITAPPVRPDSVPSRSSFDFPQDEREGECGGEPAAYATPVMLYWRAVWVAVEREPLRSCKAMRKLTTMTFCRFCGSRTVSMVSSRL